MTKKHSGEQCLLSPSNTTYLHILHLEVWAIVHGAGGGRSESQLQVLVFKLLFAIALLPTHRSSQVQQTAPSPTPFLGHFLEHITSQTNFWWCVQPCHVNTLLVVETFSLSC